jgi:quinolinate synthase
LNIENKLTKIKSEFGDNLLLLAHYYQRDEICNYADIVGDSYQLALAACKTKSRHIILCGVSFMAETARILARSDQHVYLPVSKTGCPLADMIEREEFEKHFAYLFSLFGDSIIPLLYINSKADVKASVAKANGTICTSSNAALISSYYLNKGKKIFFLPDKNLGINTANSLGLKSDEIFIYQPQEPFPKINSGIKFIVWNGFCYVHTNFTIFDIQKAKIKYPSCKIFVHAECSPEVAQAADFFGSTSQISASVKKAQAGDVIFIGTEYNFVHRLSFLRNDLKVLALKNSICKNMAKTTLQSVYKTIQSLTETKNIPELKLEKGIQEQARSALTKMINITEAK